MEGLIILLVVLFIGAVFLGFIFSIVANSKANQLRERVKAMEVEIKLLQEGASNAELSRDKVKSEVKVAAAKVSDAPKVATKLPDIEPIVFTNVAADATSKPIDKNDEIKSAKAPIAIPSEAVVFTSKNQASLMKWFAEYWTYALGGLSLALAGIYIVRLGIERGLFPPTLRVLTALTFGAALVYVAEWMRKKSGDLKSDFTAYVPSTVAAAGFAVIFSAVLGAHTLYGLIGVPTAFMGLIIVAFIAIIFGLRFGVLLSAFGIFGAFLGPFIVGEPSPIGYIMFAYTLLVLGIGLYVDSVKRTGWLSVWAMFASFAFGFIVYSGRGAIADTEVFSQAYLAFGLAFLAMVAMLPERKLMPDFGGIGLLQMLTVQGTGKGIEGVVPWPIFPVRLIWGAMGGFVVIYFLTFMASRMDVWPYMCAIAALGVLCFYVFKRGEALTDLGLVPLGLTIVTLFFVMGNYIPEERNHVIAICLLGLVFSLIAALGSRTFSQNRLIWQYVSLIYPLAFVFVMMPSYFAGQLQVEWPFFLALFAGLSAFLTYHYFSFEGLPSRRVELGALILWGYAVIAVYCFVSPMWQGFVFVLLTAPLAMMHLKAEWKFHDYAARVWIPISLAFFFAFLSIFGFMHFYFSWMKIAQIVVFVVGAYYLYIRCKPKSGLQTTIESWGMLLALIAAVATIGKALSYLGIYTELTRTGSFFLVVFAQFLATRYRASYAENTAKFQRIISYIYGSIAALTALVLLVLMPIFWTFIFGRPLLNDMLLGYLIPGLMMIAVHVYMPIPKLRLDYIGVMFIGAWALMNIRQFWQGSGYIAWSQPTGQGELVSYTVLLIAAMMGAMFYSVKLGSSVWRRVAYALIVMTGIKLYFIDLANMEGFKRVVPIMIFGAVLIAYSFAERKLRAPESGDLREDEVSS